MQTVTLTLKFSDNRTPVIYADVGMPFAMVNAQSHLLDNKDNYCTLDNGTHLTLLTKPMVFSKF